MNVNEGIAEGGLFKSHMLSVSGGNNAFFLNEIFFNNSEFRLTYQAQLSLVLTVGLVH